MIKNRSDLVQLFQLHYPDQEVLDFSGKLEELNSISKYDNIVLLYPDPIGHGFAFLERALRNNKASNQDIWALNGRGRSFRLTPKIASQLRIRRMLELVPLAECVLLTALILLSPLIMLWNTGRR
ncbi:hypothetical protein Pr1d_33350 [Bythopirellula goksoeyrii]|uniref:Uncharacterized protein n=1 Tax=Bythopirellula goksoeyrii TaxID=1400387 RepID=A0A5B9QGH0_9BACT|nr:hypothetical protein Pr1d_33350 [Bythopirellula goksoeyrii]